MKHGVSLAAVLLIVLCCISTSVWSATTGRVTGVISDAQTNEPLLGVSVSLMGTTLGAVTDEEGFYAILNVPVGTYTLRMSSVGYNSVEVANVSVSADLATYQDQPLTTSTTELDEVIYVRAERPMVIPDKVASIQIVTTEELLALPVRGFEQVVGIQAGVVSSIQQFRGGNRSNREAMNTPELFIRGGRPIEVAYYVDGFSQQDPLTGISSGALSSNAIQEISIMSGGFPVEYGHVQSGIVNVVTKSGGDEYSGTVEAVTDQVYDQNWYSMDFSGPVPFVDKLTFYGSVERRYMTDRAPSAVTADVLPGSPDRLPGNWQDGWSQSGKLNYELTPSIKVQLSGNRSRDKWSQFSASRLFQPEHMIYYDDYNLGTNFKWTHTLDAKTFYNISGSYFVTERFRGDGLHRGNLWAYGRGSNPTTDVASTFRRWDNMEIDSLGNTIVTPTQYETIVVDGVARQFVVAGTDEGQTYDEYLRRKSSYIGFKGDITRELNNEHTIKAGAEFNRHTLRFYNHRFPTRVWRGYGGDETETPGQGFRDANRYGYDYLGNETDDDGRDWRNKTKHPTDFALYLQDRIEYEGMIITAGLRGDIFDYKGFRQRNPDLPLNPDSLGLPGHPADDGNTTTLELSDLEESETFSRLSPRFGIAFPISDRSQLRVNYGQFFQRPRLQDLYVGFDYMEFQLLGSGYYTEWGNPNLEPPKTTAYEVGITKQLGDNVSFDVNAFYRATSDLIQTVDQPSMPNSFGTFRNQDYGTIKGLEFTWKMRRTRNIMFDIKYTLTYANGTGSFNTEQRNIAWVKGDPPKQSAPLDYDQRHKINAIFDIRFGGGQGPKLGETYILENFGLNVLLAAGSGLPYTPALVYNEAALTSLSPNPIDTRNTSNRPWTMSIDFKAEKTFKYDRFSISPYLWVKNLLDRDNVLNVWEGTGQPNTSGFLETSGGETLIQDLEEPTDNSGLSYEEKYNIVQQNPTYYGAPRQILFGIRVSF